MKKAHASSERPRQSNRALFGVASLTSVVLVALGLQYGGPVLAKGGLVAQPQEYVALSLVSPTTRPGSVQVGQMIRFGISVTSTVPYAVTQPWEATIGPRGGPPVETVRGEVHVAPGEATTAEVRLTMPAVVRPEVVTAALPDRALAPLRFVVKGLPSLKAR